MVRERRQGLNERARSFPSKLTEALDAVYAELHPGSPPGALARLSRTGDEGELRRYLECAAGRAEGGDEPTPTQEPNTRRAWYRRPVLVAVASVAVVLAGVAVLVSRSRAEPPPMTVSGTVICRLGAAVVGVWTETHGDGRGFCI